MNIIALADAGSILDTLPTSIDIPSKKQKTIEYSENEYLTQQNENLKKQLKELEDNRNEHYDKLYLYRIKFDKMIEFIQYLQTGKDNLIEHVKELEMKNLQLKHKINFNTNYLSELKEKIDETINETDERLNNMKFKCDNAIKQYIKHIKELDNKINDIRKLSVRI